MQTDQKRHEAMTTLEERLAQLSGLANSLTGGRSEGLSPETLDNTLWAVATLADQAREAFYQVSKAKRLRSV